MGVLNWEVSLALRQGGGYNQDAGQDRLDGAGPNPPAAKALFWSTKWDEIQSTEHSDARRLGRLN